MHPAQWILHRPSCLAVPHPPPSPPPQVIVTLRSCEHLVWRVEQAAREAFFFLSASAPFDPAAFPGYRRRHAATDAGFTADQGEVTYVFELRVPAALAAATAAEGAP